MIRRSTCAVVLLGLAILHAPLCAQGPLDAVSTDATIVVRFKAPKATVAKVADFAKQIDETWGENITRGSAQMGAGIRNQTLGGVDRSADWYTVMYAQKVGPPTTLFVIPGTSLKEMKEALGDDIHFLESGKYGIYTDNDELFEDVEKHVKSKGKSIASSMDEGAKALFSKGDIGVFINVAALVKEHGADLDEAVEKMQIPPSAAPGVDAEAVEKLAREMVSAIVQGIKDTNSFTVGVTVAKSGITVEDLLRVKSGSSFDKALQKSPPSAIKVLGSLPQGAQAYVGFQVDTASLLSFSKEFMSLNPELKALESTFEELAKLKFGASAMSFSVQADEDGAVESVTVSEVTPAAKMRDISKKLASAAPVTNQGLKQTTKFKADAEKYGSRSADVTTVTWEVTEDADPNVGAIIGTLMKTLFGEEGMTTRTVYLEGVVVQTLGGGKELMTKALAGADKPSASKAFDATRAQLGMKSNLLFMLDLPSLVKEAIKIAAGSGLPIPIDADPLDDLKLSHNYLGFSASTEAGGLRMITVVPVEQVQGIYSIVKAMTGGGSE